MRYSPKPELLLLSLLPLLVPACNGVTAAVLGSDSGDSNASGSLAALSVTNTKESPARVRFVAIDQEGDPLEVELFYRVGSDPQAPLTALVGQANPGSYAASEAGVVHELDWDFPAELGLDAGGSFVDQVAVFAVVGTETDAGGVVLLDGQNAATQLGLGNDAPQVANIGVPAGESPGVVPISFEVSDSSSDALDVRIEYDLQTDFPDAGWQLARPVLVEATPTFAVEDLASSVEGTEAAFIWDTPVDMPNGEDDVRLRFTPFDGLLEGASVVSEVFRVDNNAAPFATISEALFDINDDVRGGIPVPFSVSDPEGDPVQIVMQWRRTTDAFPDLSGFSSDEILALAEDPAARAQYQICTEAERWASGRLVPSAPDAVRLTNIAEEGSTLFANGFFGRSFEVLRPLLPLEGLVAGWSSAPIGAPVAALTLASEDDVLVLDATGPSSWRLVEVALTTGALWSSPMMMVRPFSSVVMLTPGGGGFGTA